MQSNSHKGPQVKGYIYLMIESFNIPQSQGNLTCHISLGQIAKCNTQPAPSGKNINQVFLIQVPVDPSRLILQLRQGQKMIGDCRYDVNPFFNHPGAPHSITSDIFDNSQGKQGTVTTKITYYSAEYGKLRIRVFHLELIESLANQYKVGKLKLKSAVFSQSSPDWQIGTSFDHTFEMLVLLKNGNLEIDVVSNSGILAQYAIYDLEQSGLLIEKTKAYQVSLFNRQKSVGTIKYQVDWIH